MRTKTTSFLPNSGKKSKIHRISHPVPITSLKRILMNVALPHEKITIDIAFYNFSPGLFAN
jgi:hypothetical protein